MASQDLMPDKISDSYAVCLGLTAMMTFLSTIAVICRFVSRRLTLSVKWDDWTCLGALVFAYGMLIDLALGATIGRAGYHIEDYSMRTLEKYVQITLADSVIYNVSITLSKVSMLLFYHRIFAIRKPFRIASWTIAFFVFGYFVSAECGLIFATNPIEAQWKVWLPHTSIDNLHFWIAAGIINILLDVAILCLPQPLVWKLQLSQQRRIALSVVFCMGGFVCITSIVRLIYFAKLNTNDETYSMVNPAIWTMIETNMSIICSCLATFPSLFHHIRSSSLYSKATGSYYKSNTFEQPLTGDSNEAQSSPESPKRSASGQSLDQQYYPPDQKVYQLDSVRVQTDVRVTMDEEAQTWQKNAFQV